MDMPGVGGGILGGIGLWLTARGWGLDNRWGGVLTPDMAAFHKCSLPSHSRGNVLQPKALGFCKEIQPVPPKGNQSWIFIGRTAVKAETPIVWPPDGKNWLIRKDPDAQKDWRWEKKGTTEDEMSGCITDSTDMSLSKFWALVMDREAWHAAIHGVTRSQTRLSDWAELNCSLAAGISTFSMTPTDHPTGAQGEQHSGTLLLWTGTAWTYCVSDTVLGLTLASHHL